MLTGLVLVWCLGLALYALAPAPQYLWYGRAIFGIGQSAAYAALSRLARDWFPPPIRTTLAGLVGITCGRLGGLSAYLLVPPLLFGWLGLDWRTAVYWLAAGGIAWGALFFALYRNSPRQHPLVNDAEATLIDGAADASSLATKLEPSKLTLRQALRGMRWRSLANLFALNIQTILSTLADNIFVSWIPLFLYEVHKLEFTAMGFYSALPLLGGAIAGFIGGVLNDWLIALTGSRRWSRSLVGLIGKGLAAVMLFIALGWYDNPYVFCWFLFGVKLFGDWSLTSSWGVVTDIGGRATASLFSFNNAVATVGAIAAAPLFGNLADHFGWRAVFITVGVTYVLCALSWLAIDTTIPLLDPPPEPLPPSPLAGEGPGVRG